MVLGFRRAYMGLGVWKTQVERKVWGCVKAGAAWWCDCGVFIGKQASLRTQAGRDVGLSDSRGGVVMCAANRRAGMGFRGCRVEPLGV